MLRYLILTAVILQLGYCAANIDCYTGAGEDYRGDVAVTKEGKTCDRWDNTGAWNVKNFPEKAGKGLDGNQCRNPQDTPDPKGPWCLLPGRDEGYCNIPKCASLSIPAMAEQSELAEQTIECVIEDLTAKVTGVEWSTETATANTYTGEDGEYADGTQTATLTLSKDQQVALRKAGGDTHTFTCKATLPYLDDPQTASQTITIGEGGEEEKEEEKGENGDKDCEKNVNCKENAALTNAKASWFATMSCIILGVVNCLI